MQRTCVTFIAATAVALGGATPAAADPMSRQESFYPETRECTTLADGREDCVSIGINALVVDRQRLELSMEIYTSSREGDRFYNRRRLSGHAIGDASLLTVSKAGRATLAPITVTFTCLLDDHIPCEGRTAVVSASGVADRPFKVTRQGVKVPSEGCTYRSSSLTAYGTVTGSLQVDNERYAQSGYASVAKGRETTRCK